MNPSTRSESPFPASPSGAAGASSLSDAPPGAGLSASADLDDSADRAHDTVRRMAQKAHEAVDRLEETLGSGRERMLDWQQEYGDLARDQVRASPLAAVGIAFGAGLLFARLFMR